MYWDTQPTDTHLPQGQQWRGQKQARLGQALLSVTPAPVHEQGEKRGDALS